MNEFLIDLLASSSCCRRCCRSTLHILQCSRWNCYDLQHFSTACREWSRITSIDFADVCSELCSTTFSPRLNMKNLFQIEQQQGRRDDSRSEGEPERSGARKRKLRLNVVQQTHVHPLNACHVLVEQMTDFYIIQCVCGCVTAHGVSVYRIVVVELDSMFFFSPCNLHRVSTGTFIMHATFERVRYVCIFHSD